jgi:hypothetical protein
MADEVVEQPVAAPVVEATPAPAPGRLADDPKIVSAVQAHLDAFDDIETPDTPEPVAETREPAAEPAAEPVEEPAVEPVAEPVAEPAAGTPIPKVEIPSTLPAAYVRTAKARGWTDQEIADFAKTPELALKTFERMHESRTQEIKEWAELGRKTRTNTGVPAPSTTPVSAASVTPSVSPTLAPIDIKAMTEKFGNQELIEALAGPVNAAIAAMTPLVQGATRAQEQAQKIAKENLGKTVQDFFTGSEMKPYADAYGTKVANLTSAQIDQRQKVLETADALIAGAAFQGRQLTVQDALTLAHDSVSSGLKTNIVREQLKTSVTKRQHQITLKPTNVGRAAAGGPPRSKQELLGRTEDRLAKAFG